MLLSCLKVA